VRSPALTLFVGSIPGPSGTYGSLVALAAIALAIRGGVPAFAAGLGAALLGSLLTLAFAPAALRASATLDPSWIVSDELAGQGLAVLVARAVPASGWAPLVASFAAFRLFDAWKPGPIRRLEALPGAVGVLADDLGAGLVAGALVAGAAAAHAFEVPPLAW
jgi:phosphatidylglycerophosphatase A